MDSETQKEHSLSLYCAPDAAVSPIPTGQGLLSPFDGSEESDPQGGGAACPRCHGYDRAHGPGPHPGAPSGERTPQDESPRKAQGPALTVAPQGDLAPSLWPPCCPASAPWPSTRPDCPTSVPLLWVISSPWSACPTALSFIPTRPHQRPRPQPFCLTRHLSRSTWHFSTSLSRAGISRDSIPPKPSAVTEPSPRLCGLPNHSAITYAARTHKVASDEQTRQSIVVKSLESDCF